MNSENFIKKFYEKIWETKKLRYQEKYYIPSRGRVHVALSLLPKCESLLDIGCGEGTLCYFARKKVKRIVGIDISEEALEIAKKNGIDTKVMDINQGIKFDDEEFECITCLDVLEHVFNPLFLIKEIYRVLQINGHLILIVPNASYFRYILSIIKGRFPKTSGDVGYDGGHLHYFGVENLKEILNFSNFKILKIMGVGGIGTLIKYLSPGIAILSIKEISK